uniref:MBG domain-containing protein n=1 Tax=uncultured Azonexus sp. TaxID=520307 RepID=UPI00260DD83E
GTFAYTDKNAGIGNKTVTVSGVTVNDGNSGNNYNVTYADNTTSTINKANLIVTANDASKTHDGHPFSGGNGVGYSGFVNGESSTVLGGSLAWGGTSQGAINVGSYIITPSGLTSSNYAIAYTDGILTIAALPPVPTNVPTVPGAPVNGFDAAMASVHSGGTANSSNGNSKDTIMGNLSSNLLALAPEDQQDISGTNKAGTVLPGIPGFTITPCGQALPPEITLQCQ